MSIKIRIHLLGFLCSAVVNAVSGQQVNKSDKALLQPTAGTRPVASDNWSGSNLPLNFVRTRIANAPIPSPANFSTAVYTQVGESTEYLDGLGRQMQIVSRQASGGTAPKDQVSSFVYDVYGRPVRQYLPYVPANSSQIDNGSRKTDPFQEQELFYTNDYRDANNQVMLHGESYFYRETEYETSPLSRTVKELAPGSSWVGRNRGVEQVLLANVLEDGVRIWTISNSAMTYINDDVNTNIPATVDTYGAGTLFKYVTKDEHGNAMVEYKDLNGLIILKKTQVGSIPVNYSGHGVEWQCTYYVYDDFHRLRFVLPPAAVKLIENDWTVTSTIINELCYRYEYDGRGRMIAQKTPGAKWVYSVYDNRDRRVFSQDGNMRMQNQWMATLYDAQNRQVITGMLTYTQNRDALQGYVLGLANTVSNQTVTGQSPSTLAETLNLNSRVEGVSNYHATEEIIIEAPFESETSADFVVEIVQSGTGGSSFTNTATIQINPIPENHTLIPLTLSFYDDYSWTDVTYTDAYNYVLDANGSEFPDGTPNAADHSRVKTRGLLTGTKVRIIKDPANLSAGEWLSTVQFFDQKGRIVQTKEDNYKGGSELAINQYSFSGNLVTSYLVSNTPSLQPAQLTVKTNLEYDHMGRLERIWKTVDDDASRKALIAENFYDELGKLKTKQLGQKRQPNNPSGNPPIYTSTPIEVLDYNYNIQGWLKGINAAYSRPELNNGTAPSRWFGMELQYDWGSSSSSMNSYTGNISGINWRSRGDGQRRAYGFSYDKTNRLLGADYSEENGNGYADHGTRQFDVVMGDGVNPATAYDANGNIQSMKQWGMKLNNSAVIDELTYHYYSNSNKLERIEEPAGSTDNKLGDFTDNHAGGSADYGYDFNGNMITDLNKGINGSTGIDQGSGASIVYNHLNLPSKITVKDPLNASVTKGTITYVYDALGNKHEKKVVEQTGTTRTLTTFYHAGMIHTDNKLEQISHEEGRTVVDNQQGQLNYHHDYFVKDHLGNVRIVLSDEKRIDIYPAATLEGSLVSQADAAFIEKDYYNIDGSEDEGQIVQQTAALGITPYPNNNSITNNNPNSNFAANSERLYQLQASQTKGVSGLGFTQKVQSGDRIDIFGKSYYFANNPADENYEIPVIDILTGLFGGSGGTLGGHGATPALLNANPAVTAPIGDFLEEEDRGLVGTVPKAFINYVLFDEQFNFVSGGFSRVGSANTLKEHYPELENIQVEKSGYIYVYASNESPVKVFFDNLQVVHTRGELIEETHYYPFGLTMAGISSKAIDRLQNRFKFNAGSELQTGEFADGQGLDWYATNYRSLDPQIGRFLQVDPLANLAFHHSTYAYASNNSVLLNDPLGLLSTKQNPEVLQQVVVTPGNNRNKTFKWYGWTSTVNLNLHRSLSRYGNRRETGEPVVQKNDPSWYKADVQQFNMEEWHKNRMYARQFEQQFYLIYFSAFALPFLAPEIAAVAPELILTKASISVGAQAVINGPRNINVTGVLADAFLSPGSAALINGAMTWRPFSNDPTGAFSMIGQNKGFQQAGIDFGGSLLGGMMNARFSRSLSPLNGALEKNVFEISIGTPAAFAQEIGGFIINKKLSTQK